MSKDNVVSINIENADLSAVITEYAQENANLRLAQKALVRKVNTQQIEIATLKKAEEKADAGKTAQGT